MKKALPLAAALVFLSVCLVSCHINSSGRYPLTVNSTPIDGEIFRYYLDRVWKDENAVNREEKITKATHMCIRYVAVNSTFVSYGLSLSPAEKAETAAKANVLWNMFGEHYKSVGVSKQTYLKLLTSEEYIEKLRVYFYDKGGTDEISEDALKSCFYDKYVSFNYVRTPLKNRDVYGNIVDFSEEALEKMKNLYYQSISDVSVLNGAELAYSKIVREFPATEQSYKAEIISSGEHEYSTGFFEAVKKMKEGTVSVIQYGDYIYLVYRVNIFNDISVFESYRSECLKLLSEQPLQSKINVMCNAYRSKRDTSLVNEYYKAVRRTKQ